MVFFYKRVFQMNDDKPLNEEITPEMPENDPVTPTGNTLLSGAELEAIKDKLKQEIFNELKDETIQRREQAKFRREEEDSEHARYVEKMKESPDPWVDIIGWVRTDEGVKTELDWNVAFVDYLRGEGVNGIDDEEVVQKWVTLLLRDMADRMDERFEGDFE